MTILSGHQPAYLPWMPYLHKLYVSDVFIFMDEVKFIKSDFIHRNKICNQNKEHYLTVPIEGAKNAEKSKINEIRCFQNNTKPKDKTHWQQQHFNAFRHAYRKAPYFSKFIPFIEDMYLKKSWNTLSDLCWYQLNYFVQNVDILSNKKIVRMSEISNQGAKDELVLNHAKLFKCEKIFFGEMGRDYVRKKLFAENDIKISFQNFKFQEYNQNSNNFISGLSAFDCLLNCSFDGVIEQIISQPTEKWEFYLE